MAKRRNLKKEKAERNRLYARQFRKKTSRFSPRKSRDFGGNGFNHNDEKLTDNNED